jgi:hypothetical protein
VARDDDIATAFEKEAKFNPVANDTGAALTFVSNGPVKHGTISCPDGACTYQPGSGYSGTDGFVYTIKDGSGRQSSAAVHIVVAPADTAYKLSVNGTPINGANGAIVPGGQARWSFGVFGAPEGISGQELRALGLPSGTATANGPHTLTNSDIASAKGFTSTVAADGKSVSYSAGESALLGDALTQTFPRPLPPVSQGTGGDGHVPILVGSKVFAFYHHSSPTSATCVDRATGEVCPGYPKLLFNGGNTSGFNSTDNNGPGVVQGSKIWVHLLVPASQRASIGLFCWDESTDSTCGYTIVERVATSFANGSAPVRGSDGNAWFAGDTGKAYCVDPASGATCGSVTTPLPTTSSSFDSVSHGKFAYVSRENDANVTCVDTAARALCAGWSQAQNFGQGQWNLVNRHAADGSTDGVCAFVGTTGDCMPDGDPAAAAAVNNFVHFEPHYSGSLEGEFGTRTLVGSLDRQGVGCYDWSVPAGGNPGSPCTGGDYGKGGTPGWISTQSDGSQFPSRGAYGVASDGSCAIALGDSGRVYTADPAGSAPCVSLGSGTDRTTIDLRDQRCDGTVGSAAWRNAKLSDTDSSEMDSVVVTVRDADTGEVLKSGELVGGDQTLDLSGVDAKAHPRISVDATAKSKSGTNAWDDGIPPRIRVTWKSDPQSSCVRSNGDNACGPAASTVGVEGSLSQSGAKGSAQLSLLRNLCAGGVKGEQARSCAGRRLFNINIRFKGKDIRKLTVKVKGKKQKILRMKPRPRVRIDLRKYRKGRVVVQITIVTKAGKKLTGTRVYHPCTKKRPGRGFRF